MQFLAARSLCTIFCSAKYSIPFTICRHIDNSILRTSWTCKKSSHNGLLHQLHLYKVYNMLWSSFSNSQVGSLFLMVGKKTAIGHVWHHYVRRNSRIQADSNQVEYIRVFEVFHFQALFQKTFNVFI